MTVRCWRHMRLTLNPCGGKALAAFETNTLVAGRRRWSLTVTHTLVAGWRWRRLRLTPTLVEGQHWWYLRFNLYPCGWTALAAFDTFTYSCSGTALVAFECNSYPCGGWCWRRLTLTPTFMMGRRWWHLRLTIYPFGGTALAIFEGNQYPCGVDGV